MTVDVDHGIAEVDQPMPARLRITRFPRGGEQAEATASNWRIWSMVNARWNDLNGEGA